MPLIFLLLRRKACSSIFGIGSFTFHTVFITLECTMNQTFGAAFIDLLRNLFFFFFLAWGVYFSLDFMFVKSMHVIVQCLYMFGVVRFSTVLYGKPFQCVCRDVHVCLHVCVCPCVPVEAGAWGQLSSSVTLRLVYWGKVSHLNPELNDSARLSGWLAFWPSVSASWMLRLPMGLHTEQLLCGVWGSLVMYFHNKNFTHWTVSLA